VTAHGLCDGTAALPSHPTQGTPGTGGARQGAAKDTGSSPWPLPAPVSPQ